MGKKAKKGKGRLDKYYHIAKEQGYRSRATYKLIQLNKKYQFLTHANVIIDLCAAPGGWLQVISQFTPHTSIKIGIDLDRIKPIPGVKTYQQDITTKEQQLGDKRADVVLNDGAPNVGTNWTKDAFTQLDLCLSALKLACIMLRKGGVFVTKVFRSNDYNAFIWVCNQFFGKVEANKPMASRFTSAEIFVVCQNYLAPDIIDQKLFESKHVFKDTEADAFRSQMETEVNSIDKLFQKRRRRTGYDDDVAMNMTKTIDFDEYLKVQNPFALFIDCNQIKMTKEQKDKYYEIVSPPPYYEEYIQDLLVLGRKEIKSIIKYRQQILNKLKESKKEAAEEEKDDVEEMEEEQGEEQQIDDQDGFNQDSQESEIEKQILQAQRKELKQMKKDREKKLLQIGKRGIDAGFGGEQEQEELFDIFQHKKIKKLGYIDIDQLFDDNDKQQPNLGYSNNFELEQNLEEMYEDQKQTKLYKLLKQKEAKNKKKKDIKFDDSKLQCDQMDSDEEKKRKPSFEIVKEEQQLVENDQVLSKKWFDRDLFKELYITKGDQKFVNPLKVQEKEIKQNEKQKEEQKQSKYNPDDEEESSDSDKYEDPELQRMLKQQDNNKFKKQQKQQQDEDDEDDESEYESQRGDLDNQDMFLGDFGDISDNSDIYIEKSTKKGRMKNLDNIKIDKNEKVPGELSDDDAYVQKLPKTERELRKEKLSKSRNKIDVTKEQIKDDGFEIVPEKTIEDYDIDSLAETLAIAKKMLRKRNQEDIIDSTYSKYAREDHEELPDWFVEDEKKHNFKHLPVTKESVKAERQKLLALNNRAPKKILEAKIRNKKRLEKKLKKVKQKSANIMEQEGMNDNLKMRQISKLYNKEIKAAKSTKKRLIIGKKASTGPVKKGSRSVKYVDRRLKKDKRAEKNVERAVKMKKRISKKRHVVRHKNRKSKA